MHEVWAIARHEYQVNSRRIAFRIFTLSVPVLGLILLLIITLFRSQIGASLEAQFTGGATTPQNVGVVDQSGQVLPLLPAYQQQFQPFSEEQAGRDALQAETIDALLVITPDYFETGEVRVISQSGTVPTGTLNLREFFVDHLLREQVASPLRDRLANPYTLTQVALEGTGPVTDGFGTFLLNFLLPYILSLLLAMTIFVTSGYLLQGIAKEKTGRIIEILISSVTPRQLFAGKIIGLGLLGLTQIAVWIGSFMILGLVATWLLGISGGSPAMLFTRPMMIGLAIVYYVLGFLVYAVTIGAVGALGTSQQESQQLAGVFSFMALIPIFLAGVLVPNPNGMLARILSYIPYSAPTAMLLRLSISGTPVQELPTADIIGSIIVLLITIPVVLWVGERIFRLGLLMYGQRPGLGRVLRTLRQL